MKRKEKMRKKYMGKVLVHTSFMKRLKAEDVKLG